MAINAAAKAQDLGRVQEQNELLNARLAALEGASAQPSALNRPDVQHFLGEIETKSETLEIGKELREIFEAGIAASDTLRVQDVEREAWQKMDARRQSEKFVDGVIDAVNDHVPVWAESRELTIRLEPLIHQYMAVVDQRNAAFAEQGREQTRPSLEEFYHGIRGTYSQDPRVQAQAQKASDALVEQHVETGRTEERRRLKEEETNNLAEAAQRHSGRPPSPAARTPAPGREVPAQPEPERAGPERVLSRQQAARQRVRDRYAGVPL